MQPYSQPLFWWFSGAALNALDFWFNGLPFPGIYNTEPASTQAVTYPAAPGYVNTGTYASVTSTTVTPALPPSLVAGNLLIAVVNTNNLSATNSFTVSAPWQIITTDYASGGVMPSVLAFAYVPDLPSNLAAPVFTTGSSIALFAEVLQFTPAKMSTPGGHLASNASVTTAAISCGAVTATTPNSLALALCFAANATDTWPPSGWTSLINAGLTNHVYVASKTLVNQGDSSGSWTSSSDSYWHTINFEMLANFYQQDYYFNGLPEQTVGQNPSASPAFSYSIPSIINTTGGSVNTTVNFTCNSLAAVGMVLQPNDLLLAVVTSSSGSATTSFSVAAPWQIVTQAICANGQGASCVAFAYAFDFATVNNNRPQFTCNGGANTTISNVSQWRGARISAPLGNNTSNSVNSGVTSLTCPSISATAANSLSLAIGVQSGTTPPSGYTNLASFNSQTFCYKLLSNQGDSTGTLTFAGLSNLSPEVVFNVELMGNPSAVGA